MLQRDCKHWAMPRLLWLFKRQLWSFCVDILGSIKSDSVTWTCKRRLCQEALLTAEAPAHAKPIRHVLVGRLVRAIILFSCLFHFSAAFSSLAGCPRRSLLTCEGEREKKRKKKMCLRSRAPREARAVLFSFGVFRVKCLVQVTKKMGKERKDKGTKGQIKGRSE